jgi:CRISPR-associated endoribonuclease Cas6
MLTSLVLQFTPDRPAELPRDLGRASHAIFLRLMSEREPALAQSLHESDDLRPFTCSSVFGGHRRGGALLAAPGEALWMRYTGLTEPVSRFLQALAQSYGALPAGRGEPLTLEFEGVPCRATGATLDSAVHPRASSATYEQLSAPYLLSRETPGARIDLRFVSPTAFKARGQNLPLPLPGSVFGSLLDKWNAFAPLAMPDDARRYAEECLALSRFDGRTRALRGKQGAVQIGFVGLARFTATNRDRYWLSLMNVLADYAVYAGIGRLTSQGMGQARRMEDEASAQAASPAAHP